jgi:Abnormal spindle-like microcephaly-assoc'd, ASPM-SPD-2-Hydin
MRATGTLAAGSGALLALTFSFAGSPAFAVPRALDITDPANGLTDIISQTFDGALDNNFCTGGLTGLALRDCQFFVGVPPPTRNVVVTPNPTGLANTVPGGITGAGTGTFLDLTLNGNQTELTLAGGTIAFASGLQLTIQTTTIVRPSGIAGFVIDPAPVAAAVDANGVAEFRVDLSGPTAADFSTFNQIVIPNTGDCSGPQCVLIPLLTLDMLRYRLIIDFDPTFSSFTASFIGQTGNTSLVFATLNSTRPEITVTDSVAFGNVTELTDTTQIITVTNAGTADLLLGTVGGANPLAGPFSLVSDTCTGATVSPSSTCTFGVQFAPGAVGSFSDSLDIPSNDADEPTVTVAVSGTGAPTPVPNIRVSDSLAPTTDQSVPFGTATLGTTATATVTVTNDGNANLVLGTVASANGLLAPFSLLNDACSGQTVAPAAGCNVTVQFQPTGTGAFADSFDIPSNDTADPVITVAVSGTGAALATPDIRVTDEDTPPPADTDLLVAFGNVTESTTRNETVTVTNAGNLDLVIGAIGAANPLATPFSINSDGCSNQTLAPNGSCSVIVRYAPLAAGAASDA